MFLKHRNEIALLLILLAAIFWALGRPMLQRAPESGIAATIYPSSSATTIYTAEAVTVPPEESISGSVPAPSTPGEFKAYTPGNRLLGFVLCFLSGACAIIAIFVLQPKAPLLGPDGVAFLGAFYDLIPHGLNNILINSNIDYIVFTSTLRPWIISNQIIIVTLVLLTVREFFGWVRSGFPLQWCLAHRISRRCRSPQSALLAVAAWTALSLSGVIYTLLQRGIPWLPSCGFLTSAVFGAACLWRYGADLNHFQEQLNNYQKGLPITVGEGTFSQTEAQLLDVQAQHEKAVRTAVTSERFKVELISNVSHDLRTPLTAILGYSELLQQETLSPDGQEQLRLLHLKAGYMRDLVESLFELTKVSSGDVESKMEEIDLVRLLEQTIGLFDDQLTNAGLCVRRSYPANSIPLLTDGARMHQVFANLLGNAIKYALPGTRIFLEVTETENRYLIRMMNTASYEMDFRPEEIIQRFARGDKARSTKGSGLGLAIAKTYTESVGGNFLVRVDGDQFSAIVQLPKNERNM